MNLCKNLCQVSAFFCFLSIVFIFPTSATTILGGVAGFAVFSMIFLITNIHDEIVSHGSSDIITDIEKFIDSEDCNSEDVIYQTSTCNVISSTSTISMDKMKPSSSEIQSLDAKHPSRSELEDKFSVCPEMDNETTNYMNLICPSVANHLEVKSVEENADDVHHICPSSTNPVENVVEDNTVPVDSSEVFPEMEDEIAKDINLICPSVTKSLETESKVSLADENSDENHICPSSTDPLEKVAEDNTVSADSSHLTNPFVTNHSEVESKVSLVEENAADVHLHMCPSSTDPLEKVTENNTVPADSSDVLLASSITGGVSTGNPVTSNDSDTILDEARTTISEVKSGNIETAELKEDKHIIKDFSRKFPLDTVPMEFIYPCLPYFQY